MTILQINTTSMSLIQNNLRPRYPRGGRGYHQGSKNERERKGSNQCSLHYWPANIFVTGSGNSLSAFLSSRLTCHICKSDRSRFYARFPSIPIPSHPSHKVPPS